VSFGHPSKFQRFSRLGFVTAATSLNGGQPNFARCLAVSWAGTLYVHFWDSCPLSEFCRLQNSLCVQVFRSPTLAALLYGIRAVGVSQSLRRNGITELSQRAPSILGRATITLGIGPHSSFYIVFLCNWPFYVHLLCNDIYNFQRSFFSRYHVYQQKQTQKRNHITENAITSTQPTFILLTFRSLSETFIRRSLFNSSSGSCHDSDATWQEIGRTCGSACSSPRPGSRNVVPLFKYVLPP